MKRNGYRLIIRVCLCLSSMAVISLSHFRLHWKWPPTKPTNQYIHCNILDGETMFKEPISRNSMSKKITKWNETKKPNNKKKSEKISSSIFAAFACSRNTWQESRAFNTRTHTNTYTSGVYVYLTFNLITYRTDERHRWGLRRETFALNFSSHTLRTFI